MKRDVLHTGNALKSLVLCLAFSFAANVYAQETKFESIQNADGTLSRGRTENGKKEGLWVTYDSRGKHLRFDEFKQGNRHGFVYENDDHGHARAEGWFYEGKPAGVHRMYNHGTLEKETNYEDGSFKEYYANGSVRKEGRLKENRLHGNMVQFYENGNRLSENVYENGKKNGVQKYYYMNGSLQAEYSTVMDALSGPYKEFHENGKIAAEGQYGNNLKQGTWKEYDESGKLIRTVKFKDDVEVK
ncbi:MAG: toxin-antitoxin system YwqK family antitoxin [Flavobacteriales bacterium]|nr:toxin-antitoxin system YwqK family antitoxin [Flavobacteriales bacterium]